MVSLRGGRCTSGARLGRWAAAAVIVLFGNWWAHPGRVPASQSYAFDTERMVERFRLFLSSP